jgi:copper(I)-binding protein
MRLAAVGATACLLTAFALGETGRAQSQTIQASNAWARRAPAMGSGMGSMEKMDKMDKMEKKDKMGSMSKMDKMGGGGNGAVYVTLTNAGAQADSLVSASSNAAQTVELHEAKNEGGVMKMRPVQAIPVPAKGKTELKPGGYHIMLMGLKHDLKPGENVPVTLKFERGGELRVEAAVK